MANRVIVYIGQIPLDTDMLSTNKDAYVGIAKLSAAVLGINQLLNAFTCIPTSPASMQVNVTPGEIYSLQNTDTTSYGSLGTDTHPIVKQGVVLDNTTLTLTAPGTGGNSWNYLIQIGFSETDGGSTVLPYYNASNPSQAWSGPGNNGQPNNTVRIDGVTIQAKQGTQAPTGTQTTPSPDSGFLGAFVVTVANGQTTITSGNISTYSTANFINETLTQKISQATADLRYAQITQVQNASLIYGVDTSVSANTITANLSPALTSYVAGQTVYINVANTNTGATTINLNSLGSKNVTFGNGGAIGAGDIVAGGIAILQYDGTRFQLKNPGTADFSATAIQNNSYIYATDTGSANAYAVAPTPAVASYVAGLGLMVKITNNNTTSSTLNVSGLGTKNIKLVNGNNINASDLLSGQIAYVIYDGTQFQLMNPASIVAGNFATKVGVQNSSYTYVSDSGSANAYAATLSPAVGSYTAGLRVLLKVANTNTGTSTLNVNSVGTATITHTDGSILSPADLLSGMEAIFIYDGTNFQLQNPCVQNNFNRNLIPLGDFGVNPWQVGTTFTSAATATYLADGWEYMQESGSAVVDITKSTTVPTTTQSGVYTGNSLKAVVTTASASLGATDFYSFRYAVEGYDYAKISQRSFTISFWVYATVTGTYSVGFSNSNGDYGYAANYTVSQSNTWQRVVVNILPTPTAGTWDYTNGMGLDIRFVFGAGVDEQASPNSWGTNPNKHTIGAVGQVNNVATIGNIFAIALVKLEVGNVATVYDVRPQAEVLDMAQRYYRKSYTQGINPASTGGNSSLWVSVAQGNGAGFYCERWGKPMRAAPTVIIYSTNNGATGNMYDNNAAANLAVTSGGIADTSFQMNNNSGGTFTALHNMTWQYTCDARL